jgi:diguanylate cyclase (GGDEF)-like protein
LYGEKRPGEALPLLERALVLADETGIKLNAGQALEILSDVYQALGAHARALECYRRYHAIDKELFNQRSERTRQYLLAQFRVERAEKENEIFRLRNVELEQLNRKIVAEEAVRVKLIEKLSGQSRKLEHLAKRDGLTGLFNRRYMDESLAREYARARRYREPLAVAMLDIDHFKRVNDSVSHRAGDEVLKTLAGILTASCREVDLAARYGGEEFVLAFPNTRADAAEVVCERIRSAVELSRWDDISPGLRVTVSVGLSDDTSLADHEKLLAAADERMYRAKSLGRNRVVGD